jgi:hypothetical protein
LCLAQYPVGGSLLTGVASNAYLCVWPDIYWHTDLLRALVSAGPGAASAQQRLQQLEVLSQVRSNCAMIAAAAAGALQKRCLSNYMSHVSAAVVKQKQMLHRSLTVRTDAPAEDGKPSPTSSN